MCPGSGSPPPPRDPAMLLFFGGGRGGANPRTVFRCPYKPHYRLPLLTLLPTPVRRPCGRHSMHEGTKLFNAQKFLLLTVQLHKLIHEVYSRAPHTRAWHSVGWCPFLLDVSHCPASSVAVCTHSALQIEDNTPPKKKPRV